MAGNHVSLPTMRVFFDHAARPYSKGTVRLTYVDDHFMDNERLRSVQDCHP
jgi:hypothetical protein